MSKARDEHFLSFCHTRRKIPSDELKRQFEGASKGALERDAILTRKTWIDVVSATEIYNQAIAPAHQKKVISRLKSFGYKNPEDVCAAMIHYLQNRTAVTVAFKADFLSTRGLDAYEFENLFQRGNRMYENNQSTKEAYKNNRINLEAKLFGYLSQAAYTKRFKSNELMRWFQNPNTKPRYGSLALTDRYNSIGPAGPLAYGFSFAVLSKAALQQCLFCPSDSLNAYVHNNEVYIPCTYLHFEILLSQCSDLKLKALAQRVTTGLFPNNFTPHDFSGAIGKDHYIEALFGPINFFDAQLVKHIHISTNNGYNLTKIEIDYLKENSDITFTCGYNNPYPTQAKSLMDNFMIKPEVDLAEVKSILTSFPVLIHCSNYHGEEPIHIVSRRNLKEAAILLMHHGASPFDPLPGGKTALQIAEECKQGHDVFELFNGALAKRKLEARERKEATDLLTQDRQQFFSALAGQDDKAVDVLLHKRPVLLFFTDPNGRNALYFAAEHSPLRQVLFAHSKHYFLQSIKEDNVVEVKQFLAWFPALLNSVDESAQTLIDIATKSKSERVLKLLTELGGCKSIPSVSVEVKSAGPRPENKIAQQQEILSSITRLEKCFTRMMANYKRGKSEDSPRHQAIVSIHSLIGKLKNGLPESADLIILGYIVKLSKEQQLLHTSQLITWKPVCVFTQKVNEMFTQYYKDFSQEFCLEFYESTQTLCKNGPGC